MRTDEKMMRLEGVFMVQVEVERRTIKQNRTTNKQQQSSVYGQDDDEIGKWGGMFMVGGGGGVVQVNTSHEIKREQYNKTATQINSKAVLTDLDLVFSSDDSFLLPFSLYWLASITPGVELVEPNLLCSDPYPDDSNDAST